MIWCPFSLLGALFLATKFYIRGGVGHARCDVRCAVSRRKLMLEVRMVLLFVGRANGDVVVSSRCLEVRERDISMMRTSSLCLGIQGKIGKAGNKNENPG